MDASELKAEREEQERVQAELKDVAARKAQETRDAATQTAADASVAADALVLKEEATKHSAELIPYYTEQYAKTQRRAAEERAGEAAEELKRTADATEFKLYVAVYGSAKEKMALLNEESA